MGQAERHQVRQHTDPLILHRRKKTQEPGFRRALFYYGDSYPNSWLAQLLSPGLSMLGTGCCLRAVTCAESACRHELGWRPKDGMRGRTPNLVA